MLYRTLTTASDVLAGAEEPRTVALRAVLAGATSLLVALALGRPTVAYLRRIKLGEKTEKTPIEDEALRRSIAAKSGTPTMGGVFLLASLLAGCLLWTPVGMPLATALLGTVALAVMGAVDDLRKLTGSTHRDRGLKARWKMAFQACVGAAMGLVVFTSHTGEAAPAATTLMPVLRAMGVAAVPLVVAWAALVVGLMSNGTNITDGMDGLLSGLGVPACVVISVACVAAGTPEAAQSAVFFAALAGACGGFLWFNRHPARVFMGDTGSLAVGGGMACAALAAGLDVLVLIVGLVFLVEFGSSLLQIFSFKLTGRRILPIAPLHHIPQKRNVPEPLIVRGFYVGGAVAAVLGLCMII